LKILVLYEELAGYFVNCLNTLAQNHACSIVVYCKKKNPDAPFEFNTIHSNVQIRDRGSLTGAQLIAEIKKIEPDVAFIGGWMHPPYLQVIKKIKFANCILFMDNKWKGSLRQILGSLYFRLKLKPYINSAFVPGCKQSLFAQKLGFKKQNIALGAYVCDFKLFNAAFEKNKAQKEAIFPKRFLYVGRYVKEKGLETLWQAFVETKNETKNEWELWCLGTGPIARLEHPAIKHFGFVQADAMDDIIQKTGVFVLPSTFEPWGVAVHEYAAAGFPLLCSNEVGAAENFLVEEKNGFIFEADSKEGLKMYFQKFMQMSQQDLNAMSHYSAKIAATQRPDIWATNFIKLSKNVSN
jgi:glycosyltransferase involved in cell wall biosynthesis